MTASSDPGNALLEDASALDPLAAFLDRLTADTGASRWILAIHENGRWTAVASEDSHLDELYLQVAEGTDDPPSLTSVSSADLGGIGLRLEAAGIHRVGIAVFQTGPDRIVGFLEEPDGSMFADVASSLTADPLARFGALVSTMLRASRRAAELEAISRWLPSLRALSRDEIDEVGCIQNLAELLWADRVLALRRQGDAVEVSASWRTSDEAWKAFDGVVHVHTGEHPLNADEVAAVAAFVEVPPADAWSIGSSVEARPLGIAAAGTEISSEGLSVAASLMSAASRRGRDLTAARTNALLQERARIASMIHEGITQVLTNVVLQMEVLDRLMEEPEAARTMLAKLRGAVLEALDSLRGAILELTPAAPEWSDLAGGLERFAGDFAAQWGLEVDYSVDGQVREVDPEILALVFGFVQEGLSNVRKHAGVSEARVSLTFADDAVRVEVIDAGSGYDPTRAAEEGFRQHQGLSIMRSRARLAGGSFDVAATDGGGTTVSLELQA